MRGHTSAFCVGVIALFSAGQVQARPPKVHLRHPIEAEQEPSEAPRQISHALSEVFESPACHSPLELQRAFGEIFTNPQETLDPFWFHTRCGDLLSQTPPSWWHPLATWAEIPAEKNWWPVCSMSMIQTSYKHDPYAGPARILQGFANTIVSQDSCKQFYPASPKQPTPASAPPPGTPPVLSQEAQNTLLATARKVRDEAMEACCGMETYCRQAFSRIEPRICNLQPDRTDADCPPGAAEYTTHVHLTFPKGLASLGNADDERLWKIRKTFGFDQLGININAQVIGDYDASLAFRHEFGHTCDLISRMRDVVLGTHEGRAADLSAIRELSTRFGTREEHCALTQDAIASYSRRFRAGGASADTFKCLLGNVDTFDRSRFGDPNCASTCKRQQLEEAYAEWFALKLDPSGFETEKRAALFCFENRDDEHPLGADELACFMLTRSAYEKVEKSLRCQQ